MSIQAKRRSPCRAGEGAKKGQEEGFGSSFYMFMSPGLSYVSWAGQECCWFYLRFSLRSSDLPLFYFRGLSLPGLLATAILDSFLYSNYLILTLNSGPTALQFIPEQSSSNTHFFFIKHTTAFLSLGTLRQHHSTVTKLQLHVPDAGRLTLELGTEVSYRSTQGNGRLMS